MLDPRKQSRPAPRKLPRLVPRPAPRKLLRLGRPLEGSIGR